MGNYNLNSIMEHINRIDVQKKTVQNQDVSLFTLVSIIYLINI